MFIAQLNLKGFKSFGQAHSLPLSRGLTAIVGPNGSGKSNLLDGLRWALGENQAARLRITRQQDLIFQGSASLMPGRSAEVELRMSDGRRQATLRRRFETDSGGHLYVDGGRIRLQDLEVLKRKWRLEGDRFAFIGQGEVTEVIQQRPMQRRAHLEALFGIDLYRKKRDQATDRLDMARTELERLLTLMGELRARRSEIAPEVRKAIKVRELTASLEESRRILYWLRRADLEDALRRGSADLADLRRERAIRESWTERWHFFLGVVEKRIADLDEGNRKVQEAWDRKTTVLEEYRRKTFAQGTRLRALKDDLDSHRHRMDQERVILARREEEGQQSSLRLDEARREQADAGETLRTLQIRWEELSGAMDASRRRREELLGRQAELDLQLQEGVSRCAFLGRRCRELGSDFGRTRDQLSGLSAALDEVREEVARAENDYRRILEEHRQAYATCQKLGASVQQGRREAKKAGDRLEELREVSEMEIYPRPVRYLLSASRLGRVDASPRAMVDLFSCPERITRAVEAFLGGRQFWLVVETLDEARRCIDALKTGQAGRATFLPLERCRPRRPDRISAGNGVVGWARDLLDCEPFWQDALDHVLGDLLVVEDYATGAALVRQGARYPIVTLEGDVFQPSGTVAGGARKQGPGALEVRRKVQAMEADLEERRRALELLSRELAAAEEQEIRLGENKEELGGRIREMKEELAGKEAGEKALLRDREALSADLERVFGELAEQGTARLEAIRERSRLASELDGLPESREEEGLPSMLAEARSRLALTTERVRSLEELDGRIRKDMQESARREKGLLAEMETLRNETALCREELSRLGSGYLQVWQERRALSGRFRDRNELVRRVMALKGRVQLRLERARSAQEKMLAREAKRRQEMENLMRERESLLEQWEERFPYPGASGLPEFDLEELKQEVREGERALRRMGQANMGVLSEDESLQGRLSFMEDQEKDVRQGMEELEQLIRETDREAGRVFSAALRDIDKGFNALFVRLFGGGEAHLELAEADSLWEAGVEVIARPPGKSPQNLRQLSGGEQSLTAIALLFASMEIAGVPLAVLDEVDAALDEVNLGRFADLAREYANRLQILVMTHRRLTMERADVMYGVTLSEPGLSQVVGVRLEEWD